MLAGAGGRCCYFVLLLLLAVRLLSCAHALHYHSRIARLAPKVEGRSLSAMALFIIIDADADAC